MAKFFQFLWDHMFNKSFKLLSQGPYGWVREWWNGGIVVVVVGDDPISQACVTGQVSSRPHTTSAQVKYSNLARCLEQ